MSNFQYSKKIKFHIEYDGKIQSTEISPAKNIEYLIKIAKNLFFPINKDVKIIYDKIDIIPFSQSLIGDYFKMIKKVNLKIVSPDFNSNNKNLHAFLCECLKENYCNFCRDCKLYICDNCKINLHQGHRIIEIDINNLNESINLYRNTLIYEMKNNENKIENYKEKINKEDFDLENKHDIIKEKLKKIYDIYDEMIKSLKINKNIENIISYYKMQTKITNDEIEDIMKSIYKKYIKGKKEMKIEEFKNYMKLINEKDEILDNQSTDIYKIKVKFELNEKMNNMFNHIEKIMDKTLNNNKKDEYNFDTNTQFLYNLYLKNEKKKEEENENVDNENNGNE